jgi:hypothetical protein
VYPEDAEEAIVRTQYSRVWEEVTSRRLKVEEKIAGELVAKNLARLSEISTGMRTPLVFRTTLKQVSLGRSV